MKSLVLESTKVISIRDIDIKEELTPTDVRIEPEYIGICGSDVHYYINGRIGDFIVDGPMVLGHEASGVVVETGKDVQHLKVGDRVCMEPGIPDFRSIQTMEGLYNLDPKVAFWATPPVHGCARSSVVHPAGLTFKLPDSVSLKEGALVEPVSTGIFSATKAGITPGDVAVVVGAGTIGIVTALAVLSSGCSKVYLIDLKEKKLDFIRSHYPGGIVCLNPQTCDPLETVLREVPGGADLFFEASGSHKVIENMARYLRPGGKAVLIGMPLASAPLDVVACQVKEIQISTVFRYRNIFPRTLRMMESGRINVTPLITHEFPFSQSVEAFEYAATMPDNAVKMLISMK